MSRATDMDRLIGQNIRFHRERLGWTQERLAEPLGITFQQLQKIERGVNRVSASRLFLIADLFQLPIETFREERAGDLAA